MGIESGEKFLLFQKSLLARVYGTGIFAKLADNEL